MEYVKPSGPPPPKYRGKWVELLNEAVYKSSRVYAPKDEAVLRSTASRIGYRLIRRVRKDGNFRVWFMGWRKKENE